MRYLYFAFLLLTAACQIQRPIVKETPYNNHDYTVDYLFEHDGCKVYRFRDGGYYVYFTNCNGEAIARTDTTAVRNSTRVKQTVTEEDKRGGK